MEAKLHYYDISDDIIGILSPQGEEVFDKHGFGYFLSEWEDGEVTITEKAKTMLLEGCMERSGLMAFEFWGGKRVAFMQGEAPLEGINVPKDAKDWIRNLPIETSETVSGAEKDE